MAAVPWGDPRVSPPVPRWRVWVPLAGGAAAAGAVAILWAVSASGPRADTAFPTLQSTEVSPQYVMGSQGANLKETRACDILPPLPS